MQVEVRVDDSDVHAALITVSLSTLSQAQRAACLPYGSPHRPHRLAVPLADFPVWSKAQIEDDAGLCFDLQQSVILLWDRPVILSCIGDGFFWQERIPNGVIVQAILDRLRWAEQPGEVILALEQLLLERELHEQLSDHSVSQSNDQGWSGFDTHQTHE